MMKFKDFLTYASIIIIILLLVGACGVKYIPANEVGVVISPFKEGAIEKSPMGPGLHWRFPFTTRVVKYPTYKISYTMNEDNVVEARTSDNQRVFVDSTVIFSIDPDRVVYLHLKWGDRYKADLVKPVARGVIREVISQYRVDDVVSKKRLEIVYNINSKIAEKLAEEGLILHDFILRDIDFTAEYAEAVEQKQIAEQQAKQARFLVEQKKQEAEQLRQIAQGEADAQIIRAKGEAEARLIQARAEAEAIKLIAEALRGNESVIQYQYISTISPEADIIFAQPGVGIILDKTDLEGQK